MKKILSLVLVLSLVLGSFSMAFAATPTDVAGTAYEDAVERLMALSIVGGVDDSGTFQPERTITRAEFAKIIANILGVGAAADYSKNQTKFTDVPATHWAAGYINVVSDMGVIKGQGDGSFAPQAQVTYKDAITMIVRALGYEPKAITIGGYPGGYLAVAAEKDITEDVTVAANLPAPRGDVAIMVNAALTVDVMEQATFGPNPEWKEMEGKNLMTSKLGVKEIKSLKNDPALVTAIPKTDNALDSDQIKIRDDKYTMQCEFNPESLLGVEIKAWEKSGDVFYFEVKTDEDDMIFDTVKTLYTADEKIKLANKGKKYKWAEDAEVYVNLAEKDTDDVAVGMYGYTILNDKGEIRFANYFNFSSACGVANKVDGDVIDFVDLSADEQDIDLADFEDGVYVYDEKFQTIDKDVLDVDSAFYTWKDDDEVYVVVYNNKVEGALERAKNEEIKIAGTYYDALGTTAVSANDKDSFFAFANDVTKLDDLSAEDVVAVLGLKNELLLVYGDSDMASGTIYGLVTFAEKSSKSKASVYTKDGEVDYVFETRNDVDDVNLDDHVFNNIDTWNATTKTGNDNLAFAAASFKLNKDGKIKDGTLDYGKAVFDNAGTFTNTTTHALDALDAGASVKEASIAKKAGKAYIYTETGEKYYITEDTVFMNALGSTGSIKNSSKATIGYKVSYSPSVANYEDIKDSAFGTFATGSSTTVSNGYDALVFGDNGKDAKFIVFMEIDFQAQDDDYFYGIVTKPLAKDSSDYFTTMEVAGEGEKEYIVADETKDWKVGSLVKFNMNSKDQIVWNSDKSKQAYEGVNNKTSNTEYKDGYLTFNGSAWTKVDSSAIILELDAAGSDNENDDVINSADNNGKLEELALESNKLSRSKLDRFDKVSYILDGDNIIQAAVVWNNEVASTPTPTPGTTHDGGVVTLANQDTFLLADGTQFFMTSTTKLKNAAGTVYKLGGSDVATEILDYIVKEIEIKDGKVSMLQMAVDFTAINTAVDTTYKALYDGGNTKYTAASWTAFTNAYDAAENIAKSSTQLQVDAKLTALNDAKDALVLNVLKNTSEIADYAAGKVASAPTGAAPAAFADVKTAMTLPSTVTFTMTEGTITADVDWDANTDTEPVYTNATAGTYVFKGTLTLQATTVKYDGTLPTEATINVIVAE